MDNREKIVCVLRRSPLTSVTYTDLKVNSGVPAGSFDRTLATLVRDGTVLKGGDDYRIAGDGSVTRPQESRTESGFFVLCALRRVAPATRQGERGDV